MIRIIKNYEICLLINFEVNVPYGSQVILIMHINKVKALTQALSKNGDHRSFHSRDTCI